MWPFNKIDPGYKTVETIDYSNNYAYSYAEEYLLDNATQATARIADLMKAV